MTINMSGEDSAVVLKRLQWRSRRGLLELDLILRSFVGGVFPHIAKEDYADYARLMDMSDPELLFLLQNSDVATEDSGLDVLIRKIIFFAKDKFRSNCDEF